MIDKIIRLDFAYIECDESVLFKGGKAENKIPIGCFAWLLQESDGSYTLIDTGIEDIAVVNSTKRGSAFWHRGDNGRSLSEHLKALNISEEKIKKLILTHAHYDHISGITALSNATVYVNRLEYEFAMSEDNPFAKQLLFARDALDKAKKENRLVLCDGNFKVSEDIKTVFAGGHTVGSQMVNVKCGDRNYLFTGDAVFLMKNVSDNMPVGLTQSEELSEKALKYCINFDGTVLTSHDLFSTEEYKCLI